MDGAGDADLGQVWTVGAVARRIGVSPSTLRSWGRRYGVGPVGHEAGRHRRYTVADVTELDTMCRLVEQGVAVPAAAIVARDLRRTTTSATASSAARCLWGNRQEPPAGATPVRPIGAVAVNRVVRAARSFASETVSAVLDESFAARGVVETWNHLCCPALDALDDRPADPGGCVDAQLLLSWAVATGLRRRPVVPAAPGAPSVLLACCPGEHHTLALEALLAALVERGVHAQMMGPSVPLSALVSAAERMRPTVVVVWAQLAGPTPLFLPPQLFAQAGAVLAAGPGWVDVAATRTTTTVESLQDVLAFTLAMG